MSFRVEYCNDGGDFHLVQEGIAEEDLARHIARRAMAPKNADFVRVINESSGAEVWSLTKGEGDAITSDE